MPKRRVLAYSLDPSQPGDQFLFNLLIAPVAITVNFVVSLPGALEALFTGRINSRVPATLLIAIGAFIPAVTDSLNRFGSTEWFQLGKLLSVLFLLAGFLVSSETFSEDPRALHERRAVGSPRRGPGSDRALKRDRLDPLGVGFIVRRGHRFRHPAVRWLASPPSSASRPSRSRSGAPIVVGGGAGRCPGRRHACHACPSHDASRAIPRTRVAAAGGHGPVRGRHDARAVPRLRAHHHRAGAHRLLHLPVVVAVAAVPHLWRATRAAALAAIAPRPAWAWCCCWRPGADGEARHRPSGRALRARGRRCARPATRSSRRAASPRSRTFQAATLLRCFSLLVYSSCWCRCCSCCGRLTPSPTRSARPDAWALIVIAGVFSAALPGRASSSRAIGAWGPLAAPCLMLLEPVTGVLLAALLLAEQTGAGPAAWRPARARRCGAGAADAGLTAAAPTVRAVRPSEAVQSAAGKVTAGS